MQNAVKVCEDEAFGAEWPNKSMDGGETWAFSGVVLGM